MRKLITSALPYTYGMPHLGNIIGSVLPADVYARFCRLSGEEVLFVCGSDSHGTMYEIAAKKAGISAKELAYQNHEKVKQLFDRLEINFDFYGITDSKANEELTRHIFLKLDENGFISEKEVENTYCENCQMFLSDRYVEGKCPYCGGLARGDQCDDCGKLIDIRDLIEPYCVLCKNKVVFRKTKHLFLELPKLKTEVKEFASKSSGWSKLAKSETLGFLKQELKERAITRDANWGFPVPRESYEKKVFYVWFDAPIGYLAFTKEFCEKNNQNFEAWWKSSETEIVQFMGKDNTLFHTVIFPAMLIGTRENWKLTDRIRSCGWLKAEGTKFSKSRGKGLTTEEALDKYPADYWRFVLISLYPEQDDTVFSMEVFKEKVNNEFADIIGNFVHRVITFCHSNYEEIPGSEKSLGQDSDFNKVYLEVTKNFSEGKFQEAMKNIVHYGKLSNAYFNNNEPWKKEGREKEEICFVSANLVKNLAIMLYPIVPEFSEKVFDYLNVDKNKLKWDDANKFDLTGKINKSEPLIQKLD